MRTYQAERFDRAHQIEGRRAIHASAERLVERARNHEAGADGQTLSIIKTIDIADSARRALLDSERTDIPMSRSEAATFIETVRRILAEDEGADVAVALRHAVADLHIEPLQPCKGEAHRNAYIDNCMSCAPRWGWVGAVVKVR